MEYIIDGYNLIRSTYLSKAEKHSTEFARNSLTEILTKYKRKHPSINFTVVFDGQFSSADSKRQKIKVFFSGDITADELIQKILERKKTTNEIIVVSDDREIQTGTKILGGHISKTAEFLEKISPALKHYKQEKEQVNKNLDYKSISTIEKELKKHYGVRS